MLGLSTLPYDLLLNIASYLNSDDIHALNLTCKALHSFAKTRPVYRKLASDLLRRCRALPLRGFQQLSDLSTEQLVRAVDKATRYENAWKTRGPRPITAQPYVEEPMCNGSSTSTSSSSKGKKRNRWYKVVSAPPDEDVDWLSPITSSYTLCATKRGRVVCWDVQTDKCLAEWNPDDKWELWKCRVEFTEKTVYFTMARTISGGPQNEDERVMEFVLMRLTFSDPPSGEPSKKPPIFSEVTDFRTVGMVMNVFLLDPASRLLSAFIWVPGPGTIGLYTLLDWDKKEYVFIDTGIETVSSSNWSCIMYQGHIVIHCEETDIAYQHFYPISMLQKHMVPLEPGCNAPTISARLRPYRTLSKTFIFPPRPTEPHEDIPVINGDATTTAPTANGTTTNGITVNGAGTMTVVPVIHHTDAPNPPVDPPNPFPFPPWFPESAHFVRQWWPTLSIVPRISCTVVLLASHDTQTHRTQFILAQHYFRVPINHVQWFNMNDDEVKRGVREPSPISETMKKALIAQDDALMHMWYVSMPFEVVRVYDAFDEEEEGAEVRPRPLVAVDFGHAAWIEYYDPAPGEAEEYVVPSSPSSFHTAEFEEDDNDTNIHDVIDVDESSQRTAEMSSPVFPPSSFNETHVDSSSSQTTTGTNPAAGAAASSSQGEHDAKRLRFVTFPSFKDDIAFAEMSETEWKPRPEDLEGTPRTLAVPEELDLGTVDTINIDQSQGAVILSDRNGKIFILCYE
ncbi:hypothetical protein BKA70DRAFT_1388898 [Coprinopsis sp. MPI-PUGE-AT-0042]|nr:hypothetical protein BKA70DRAFT_1388898 [Coprinopsis sp. MPI-PUGE-AT-0042]